MKKIIVKNCYECPFCNNDNEYGRDQCNLEYVHLKMWDELPKDNIYEKCPLKNDEILISIF